MPHIWARLPAFPSPRKRDVPAGADLGAEPELALPTARRWVGLAHVTTAAQKSVAVSPRFLGPALIHSVELFAAVAAGSASGIPGVQLLYATDGGGATGPTARDPLPAGVQLYETTLDPTIDLEAHSDAFWRPNFSNTVVQQRATHRIGQYVAAPEFFLKLVAFTNDAAVTVSVQATVLVYESIERDLVPDYVA